MMTSCSLRIEVHTLWVHRSELLYPVALPSSCQDFVNTSHDFKDCNPEIVQGVAWAVKMASYWFSVRLCVMTFQCPLRRMWRGFCVSPSYCFQYFRT